MIQKESFVYYYKLTNVCHCVIIINKKVCKYYCVELNSLFIINDNFYYCSDNNSSGKYSIFMGRIRYKIKNLVSNLHNQLALLLCKNHQVILIPIFDSKTKIEKGNRNIGKSTVRMIQSFRHYDFRLRLKDVSKRFDWCHVVETREPYTSKTCGNCGFINDKLGSKKKFECSQCHYCADRDANGARNILLRYLTIMDKEGTGK